MFLLLEDKQDAAFEARETKPFTNGGASDQKGDPAVRVCPSTLLDY